ncbi:MAG: flippase [Muribaculum sp.]|nr:flippase [Muribaculum sp.]
MAENLKNNFGYSAVLTTANYLFPLLTFPYITRVLGVSNVGICNFVDSIINYFILFSSMGIGAVGIREIAKSKDDKNSISTTFSSLLTLNLLFTVVAIIILIFATLAFDRLREYQNLMFIGAFKLLFNLLLVEWFYKGLEKFRYITIRTLIIKCIYVVSVFLFIKKSSDYGLYYFLSTMMIIVNALINILYSSKFVNIRLSFRKATTHFRSFMILGVYLILTSMYTTFNVTFLGFVCDTAQVGYYTTATKLYSIIIALFSAFTGVMLPHMSSLLAQGNITKFKDMFCKSTNLLISLAIPIMFFAIAMAPQIVDIIAGKGYEDSILPMRIVLPLLFIIGYEQILVIQTLMPLKKDSTILKNSIVSAVVGVSLNFLLVVHFKAVGSAIIWVICELVIMLLSQIAVSRTLHEGFPFVSLVKSISIYSPLLFTAFIFNGLQIGNFAVMLISGMLFVIYFIATQYFFYHDGIFMEYTTRLLKIRIKKGKNE